MCPAGSRSKTLPVEPVRAVTRARDESAVAASGSAMERRVRDFDWTTTPVGPTERWPQSLRTAASICLASRFPIVIFWGAELTLLYNDAYRPYLGATKDASALGRPAAEVWAEIWDVIAPMLRGVLDGGRATFDDDLQLLIERRDFPEECYFTFSYSPITVEGGGVGGVFCAVAETTARVLGERRLRTLRDLGAEATGAKSADDACDRAARVLAENPADVPFALIYLADAAGDALRLAGLAGIAAGRPASPALVSLGGDAPGGWPLAAALASGAPQVVADAGARFGQLPGGPWPDPSSAAVLLPLGSPDGARPVGAIVLGISPRRAFDEEYRSFMGLVAGHAATAVANARAREEERRRAEALAELDRAKTAFFSNVSHEFRTPLTLMLGPVEELLAGGRGPLTPAQRDELAVAHRSSLRLLRLVNTLLDFSRIEAGRIEASYEPTDLSALTADIASVFRSAVERAGLRLVVDCPPLPESVHVDREMWEKIVLNLLSNAFKHTFAGEIAVSLHAAPDRRTVVLEVRDTGTGIPAEELPRLFERFHRVRNQRARTHEGTGIGLALVQELVKLHGGSVAVRSRVSPGRGHGTTFAVTIPTGDGHLAADRIGARRALASTAVGATPYVEEALRWLPGDPDPAETPPDRAEEAPGAGGWPGPSAVAAGAAAPPARVLLADDNADMRGYVARLLARRYAVQAVADGEAALAAALERPPDLVLADVMMPALDGFGLLRALRGDERTREVPVVLLSARAGEEAKVEGLRTGADDYLVKPFSARELLARVGTHLRLARDRAETRRRLAAERARLHELFERAPAVIAVLRGPEHVFELVNPAYLALVGRLDVLGKAVREALPEIEGQGFFEVLDRVYATGEPYVGTEVPMRIDRRGDGTLDEAFVDFVYQPVREDGRVAWIFAHGVEVTAQVRARREIEALAGENARLYAEACEQAGVLARLNAALREFVAARDELLSSAAHDLKTPLTAIKGFSQFLGLRRGDGDAVEPGRLAEGLAYIDAAASEMGAQLDELNDLARLQLGQPLALRRRPTDLGDLARRVAAAQQWATERDAIRVETPPDALVGNWDDVRLARVVHNLIANAVKYSPARSVVTVKVAREEAGGADWAVLAVQDAGVGIPAAELPCVFDRFRRASNVVGRIAGTGIGLASARQLLEQHGGTISVESREGEGSTFTVRLPLERGDDREAGASAAGAAVPPPGEGRGP